MVSWEVPDVPRMVGEFNPWTFAMCKIVRSIYYSHVTLCA